jgi:hypothetical protein
MASRLSPEVVGAAAVVGRVVVVEGRVVVVIGTELVVGELMVRIVVARAVVCGVGVPPGT